MEPRRDVVLGECIKLHIGMLISCLKTQYFSGDKIENIEIGVACGRMGVRRGVYIVLVGRPSKRNHFGDAG